MNFSVNKLLLAYLNKKGQIQNERFKYRNNAKESKGEKSRISHSFLLKCISQIVVKCTVAPRHTINNKQKLSIRITIVSNIKS